MKADYHKETPQAVRMPDGLKARVRDAAEVAGETVNAFIVAAIEERLKRHEHGATTAARSSRNGATTSPAPVAATQRQPRRTAKPREAPSPPAPVFQSPQHAANCKCLRCKPEGGKR